MLELWSLFDFLMPGFLGTERQFQQMYSKPILASKDPKCTPKDQEARPPPPPARLALVVSQEEC